MLQISCSVKYHQIYQQLISLLIKESDEIFFAPLFVFHRFHSYALLVPHFNRKIWSVPNYSHILSVGDFFFQMYNVNVQCVLYSALLFVMSLWITILYFFKIIWNYESQYIIWNDESYVTVSVYYQLPHKISHKVMQMLVTLNHNQATRAWHSHEGELFTTDADYKDTSKMFLVVIVWHGQCLTELRCEHESEWWDLLE